MAAKYRIDYTIQRRRDTDEDYVDIGFGSTGRTSSSAAPP